MQQVRFRPVEVPEAELKQQYIRCLDYLMTAQRNAYYSLMQTTPSTVLTVKGQYTTYHSSVLKFQRSWIMYTKARPRSTSNSMLICLRKEQRKGMLQRCKCILLRLNQWSPKTRRTPRNLSMQTVEQGRDTWNGTWMVDIPPGAENEVRIFSECQQNNTFVKSQHYERALQIFAASGVNVTTDATKYLGGYVGPRETCDQLTRGKVSTLITHLEKLSKLAKAEPHAAYSYFVSRFQHTYTYVLRVTALSEQIWKPLEETIRNKFTTAVWMRYKWRVAPSSSRSCEDGQNGYSRPQRHCNNKLCSITKGVWSTYSATTRSATRVPGRHAPNTETRNRKNTTKKGSSLEGIQGDNIFRGVTTVEKAARSYAGASSWLSARPLKESDLHLSKCDFRDLIRLRYLLPLENMPLTCVCAKDYTITHALTWASGGFIIKRYNEVRDYLAQLRNEVCADVSIEPHLVQVTSRRRNNIDE